MIDPASARMLAEIAARAGDMLNAYKPGAEPRFSDVTQATRSTSRAESSLSVTSADGYFVVEERGRRAFTKDGTFAVREGALTTASGAAVYGYADTDAQKRGILIALRIDPIDAALKRHEDMRIESDGHVVYTRTVRDAKSGAARPERAVLGVLALARFPAGTKPEQLDPTRLGAPAHTRMQIGAPADGAFAPLATNSADRGAYDMDAALERLHDAYQSLDALRAAKAARGKTDRTAMDLIK